MSRSLLSALVSALFCFGLIQNASAITFGQPDGDQHPYVGTLLFVQNGVGFYSCSGTLIAPTVMVTAGHCTEAAGNVNDVTYVRFEEDALADIGSYGSPQDWFDNEWILAAAVIPHPNFADYAEFPNIYDVGLVILSEPVILDDYAELPALDLLEAILDAPGNSSNRWTVVGYGDQGVLLPFASADYARYSSTARLIEINSTFTGPGSTAKFSNHPGGGRGGACFGDSGGPIFYDDSLVIGAIVSWGITPCIGVEYHYRLDTQEALDFITSNLPQ